MRICRGQADEQAKAEVTGSCPYLRKNSCADLLFLLMERKDIEQKGLSTFLVEKLGRGIRIMSGNVETPKLPSKMEEVLARLAKAPPPRK